MKKIYAILSLVILMFAGNVSGQDIHFSQVNETPLFLSPANTGFFNGYVRVSLNYRNQWASMNNAFQTYALSVDGGLFKSRRRKAFMGMGFTLFTDEAGAAKIRKTTALFNLSGLLKINRRSSMSVGLAGGAAATNADYSKLTYASQFEGNNYDPSISSGEKWCSDNLQPPMWALVWLMNTTMKKAIRTMTTYRCLRLHSGLIT